MTPADRPITRADAPTPDNTTFDVVVIGAGPAGENTADYAIRHGLTAAVVEAELVGGECSYWACMPSKALLRPTEVLAAARRVPAAASAVTGEVDVDEVLASRDRFAAGWDDKGQVDWLASAGIALFRGHGRLAGTRTVEVSAVDGTGMDGAVTTLTAERAVVVATGTAAATPPIDGLEVVTTWDTRDITAAEAVPERLTVLGGGVVGVEMAQAWSRLGATVTVVEAADRILGRHEPFASDELAEALRDEGITILEGAMATAVTRDAEDGAVTVTIEDGREVVGDELVVAVGRRALTDDLGLDSVGVEPGNGGYVAVDGHLRALDGDGRVVDGLYVVGDANGRALLTHQGKYQARLVGAHAAGVDTDEAWADERALPGVVFTDPNVASVGLTEAEAREQGIDVQVVSHATGHVAGAAVQGKDFRGTSQLLIDAERDAVVGATFVGPGVGELLHAATIAIAGEVPLSRLWHAVPAFPTVSEVWLRLLEAHAWSD